MLELDTSLTGTLAGFAGLLLPPPAGGTGLKVALGFRGDGSAELWPLCTSPWAVRTVRGVRGVVVVVDCLGVVVCEGEVVVILTGT